MGTHSKTLFRTQAQMIDETIARERTFAALCTCFGVFALVMACVGLYATTAYAVIRRTNEIGIRMALGAMKGRILWMVVNEVLVLGVAGLLIGFGVLWEITTYLKSFLWGLAPHDPVTFASAGVILSRARLWRDGRRPGELRESIRWWH